jgi:hypothetical protein
VAEVALDARRPLLPSDAFAFADARRRVGLGVAPVEFEVTELGVGHQRPVDEQARADARAERQHEHHAVDALRRAPAHLGKPGGIGVVHHGHVDTACLGEQAVGVDAQPAVVDVRCGVHHAVPHDPGEADADRTRPPCRRTSSAATSAIASGVAGLGVGMRIRSDTSSPVSRSTIAAFMPEPPMSMPNPRESTWRT